MMLLADVAPSGAEFSSFLNVGRWVLEAGMFVVTIWALTKRREVRRIEPQPFEIRHATEFVRKEECLARHELVESQLAELRDDRSADIKQAAISRAGMYKQMDEVRKELSEKIDSMPAQIIAILSNTGALGKHKSD